MDLNNDPSRIKIFFRDQNALEPKNLWIKFIEFKRKNLKLNFTFLNNSKFVKYTHYIIDILLPCNCIFILLYYNPPNEYNNSTKNNNNKQIKFTN